MVRKYSKKKIYSDLSQKKNNKKQKKSKVSQKKKLRKSRNNNKKQRGGSSSDLENTVRKVIREENNNVSETKKTRKKGLVKSIISMLPGYKYFIREPEHIETMQLQKQRDITQQEKIEKEIENTKSQNNVDREELKKTLNEGIDQLTKPSQERSLSSMVGSRVRDIIKDRVSKTVDTISGTPKKIAETTQEVKRIATQRQCDAQFITGLDNLLNTCSKEELINVYNEIVKKMIDKSHFFTPRLEGEIEKLPILEYNTKKENRRDLNVKGLEISKADRNTITKLQNNIDRELQVKEKLSKLKGPIKSKKKIIATKITEESKV